MEMVLIKMTDYAGVYQVPYWEGGQIDIIINV